MAIREKEMKSLKEMILTMASYVEVSIRNSVRALVERDVKLAERVIKNDHLINTYDIKINEECIRLLALRAPVAKELRFITTGMKITTDLERIADHSSNISERVIEIKDDLYNFVDADIPRMKDVVQNMVKDSIDAFVNEDKALAISVIERDDEVDDLNISIIQNLINEMTEKPHMLFISTKLSHISRSLERIADHSTNIAEMVIYMIDGRIIRHIVDIKDIEL
ncbi:phosphate transport system regulatory protein PhoU [Candidatus Magnetoovum chiemensis]|nr:phosphate transport system regulatory protein PhoU [Candidatus Magnetoovum chiemensis]